MNKLDDFCIPIPDNASINVIELLETINVMIKKAYYTGFEDGKTNS